ncbi:MAG TPA: hypothetical protein VJQ47_02030 [Steroidobacteraceae bacterium]|nr:hypothetical protein [Steroidobacteraceae bacterium]
MRGRWLKKGLAFLVMGLVFVGIMGFIVMELWNALVPSLFTGPVLHYWQAVGLLVLSRILFGGLRGRGWRGHGPGWRARWERLTPEERERLRDSCRKWKQA